LKLIKKMVGAGYKLLGMPYHIVLWTIKNSYKVLKEALNYTAKGVELIIGLVLKTINTLWKIIKAPLPWGWKQVKKIKPKAIFKWVIDVIKESIAQIFTLLGFYIAWFTLTGTAQDIVGIAIVISTAIWLLTIRLRD
jgi:hypothetical protein